MGTMRFITRFGHDTGRAGPPRRWARRAVVALAAIGATVCAPVTVTHAAGLGWIPMGTGLYDANSDGAGIAYATLVVGGVTYVGGSFTDAGGVAVNNVAVWDGTTFHALGNPDTDGPSDSVWSLATDGTHIFAGGPAGVMSWNPGDETWTDLGVPADVAAYALLWYDDGVDDPYLVLGGDTPGGVCELLWYDAGYDEWSPVASLAAVDVSPCTVYALAQLGDQLVIGGQFEQVLAAGNFASLVMWDGAGNNWSQLSGVSDSGVRSGEGVGSVYALTVDPATDTLFIGGTFDDAGGTATTNLAAWTPGEFVELGGASTQFDPVNDEVDALAYANGTLAVGGWFALDGTPVNVAAVSLATDEWMPFLGGTDDVVETIGLNETLGQVYVGGDFRSAYSDTTPTPVANTAGIAMLGETGAPPSVTGVTVTGTPTVGNTLTAHVTTTGDPAPTVTLEWIRCDAWVGLNTPAVDAPARPERLLPTGCVVIDGATATTYTLVAADAGKHIGVIAFAENDFGAAANLIVQQPPVAAAPTTPTTTINPTLPATGSHGSLPTTALLLVTTGLVLLVPARRRWLR